MGVIRRLSSELIDRIAAGEVIERPASVAKELVENALDAGAATVEVELSGGGLERIVVTDDGSGMEPEDARLCLERHATSKLASADDLFNIRSLGFRGEALSSIAAVSRLTLTTRPRRLAVGTRLNIAGGELGSVAEAGCPAGTSIEVRDLFYNQPARRKFMRAPATEQAHVVEACTRALLGSERAGMVVSAGGRRLLDVPPGAAPELRARAALGPRASALYPFEGGTAGVAVRGLLAPPSADRADAKGLWLFVNGRFVRDRTVQRAVLDACRGLLPPGRYPAAVVHLEVPPASLDVNVHPQKLEVRFADAQAVYRATVAALTSLLAQAPWLGESQRARSLAALERAGSPKQLLGPPAVRYHSGPSSPIEGGAAEGGAAGWFGGLEVIAHVGSMLIARHGERTLLVDAGAAREQAVAARLYAELAAGAVEPRPLLFPEILEAPPAAEARWSARAAELEPFGFVVEAVGPARFVLRSVPALLGTDDARSLVQSLLAGELALEAESLVPELAHWAGTMAGRLEHAEIRASLAALDALELAPEALARLWRAVEEDELRRLLRSATGA